MRFKTLLCSTAAAATLMTTMPADAAIINLIDKGGVTGSKAEAGFKIAALYWGNMFTNNVTINLQVGFSALGTGIIGSTGSTRADYSVANWESRIAATRSGSTIDQTAILPTLTAGKASFITNGTTTSTVTPPVGKTQAADDLSTVVYDNGATLSSQILYMNSSVIKAIGGTASGVTSSSIDGSVTFSNTFGFDFDPTDGISANTFDFIGVAIHEIGHALGFVSGVDFLDAYGVNGGTTSTSAGTLGYSLNTTSIYSALDMFRYSADPTNLVPGGAALDLSAGTQTGAKYFSIDGGQTALFGNTFSQGAYAGDGSQASHWKDTAGCVTGLGIMDPTFCYAQMGAITGLDLAAFDAMGWNLSTNALTYQTTSTSTIFKQYAAQAGAVPEPATWGMMILGFGLLGGAMRRRSMKISFAI